MIRHMLNIAYPDIKLYLGNGNDKGRRRGILHFVNFVYFVCFAFLQVFTNGISVLFEIKPSVMIRNMMLALFQLVRIMSYTYDPILYT